MKYVRVSGLPHQTLDGETLIVVPKKRLSHHLNETATLLWDRLAAPRTLDELVAELEREFEVEPDRARADLQAHLDEMESLGLVTRGR